MSSLPKEHGSQGRMDRLTQKWWLYIILLLLFFIPSQASRDFDPRNSMDLVGQVLSDPLIYAFPVLMPVAKAIPVLLIAGLLLFGNRVRRAFNIYIALLYIALAIFQTTANTDDYGFVVLTGNLVLLLVVGILWVWESIVQKNDFTPRKIQLWRWWVVPVAAVAFLAPVNASTMTPDFHAVRMLTNEAGLTACMMTPVVLAVLTLYHPTVNNAVLRVSSFLGMLLGAINMIVWFGLERWGWWMGVMHIPLLLISIYGFVLGHLKTGES